MRSTIRDGVFFTAPPALPRGRHSIPRKVVAAAQRERLLIAAAELSADRGYASIGVRDLCERAAVSQSVFYERFHDKDDCIFAMYQRFVSVLSAQLQDVAPAADGWHGYLDSFVQIYLEALNLDRVVARACLVEMDALGEPGRALRRSSIRQLSSVTRARWSELNDAPIDSIAPDAFVAATYLVRQLAADALDETPERDLRSLHPIATELISRLTSVPPVSAGSRHIDVAGPGQ